MPLIFGKNVQQQVSQKTVLFQNSHNEAYNGLFDFEASCSLTYVSSCEPNLKCLWSNACVQILSVSVTLSGVSEALLLQLLLPIHLYSWYMSKWRYEHLIRIISTKSSFCINTQTKLFLHFNTCNYLSLFLRNLTFQVQCYLPSSLPPSS